MEVRTLAGSDIPGSVDGVGSTAKFNAPQGVAVDSTGVVYVADYDNDKIRKVLPDGTVSTLAGGVSGFADGRGYAAKFNHPSGVAVDSTGVVYVADSFNHRIRKILPDGRVSTLAGRGVQGFEDGAGAVAQFRYPEGIAVDRAGVVYVADSGNRRIRKILPDGTVSTLAGSDVRGFADGVGAVAHFYGPAGVCVDSTGVVYVADTFNHRIRKILPDGTVSTLAGRGVQGFEDGEGAAAEFYKPYGIVVTRGVVYVADSGNNCIRMILSDGTVSTVAGREEEGFADRVGAGAQFYSPQGIATDGASVLYVGDAGNNRIRKLIPYFGNNNENENENENRNRNENGAEAASSGDPEAVSSEDPVSEIPVENLLSSAFSNRPALPTTYRDLVNLEDVAPGTPEYTFFVVGKSGFALDDASLEHYTKDNAFKLYKCRKGTPLTSLYIRAEHVHMASPLRILQFEFPVHVLDQQAQHIQSGRTYRLTPTADQIGQIASHATIQGESVVSGNHCQEKRTDRIYKIEEIPVGRANASSYENLLGLGPNGNHTASSKPNYGLSNLNRTLRGQMIENAFRGLGGYRVKKITQTKRRKSKSRTSSTRRKGSRLARKRNVSRRR